MEPAWETTNRVTGESRQQRRRPHADYRIDLPRTEIQNVRVIVIRGDSKKEKECSVLEVSANPEEATKRVIGHRSSAIGHRGIRENTQGKRKTDHTHHIRGREIIPEVSSNSLPPSE